jgi:hypothetical protein
MSRYSEDSHVLPRPVEHLAEYADARARRNLAEKLVQAFGLPEDDAATISNAVVDPSAVRKSIGDPADPEAEQIAVPGGTLLGIRTEVWSRRVAPDARNPRLLPNRRHPFAVEPGTGADDSKFRPVPEPRARDAAKPDVAALTVDIESREHLNWACQQAASFILAENDWRDSIASQGVMEAVWLVSTRYEHSDGCAPANVLVTAEGSSRMTGVHDLLGIRSADVPYDDNEAKLRANIRKLNDALDRGATADQLVALRCERVPALILVGFRRHGGSAGFPTAVKSLVALRHVDSPKPWGPGPENESLADEVLDELFRQGLISQTERGYLGGSCTRAEARAAHLPDDPAMRAARIVHLFANKNARFVEAIRVAVTSQSTRKRITQKLANDLATALILRAAAFERARTDQVRRYLREAFGKAVHGEQWQITGRDAATLKEDAIKELRQWIGNQSGDPGPASLELAVRGAYALVVSGRLNADRGSAGNEQPDRRTPGEVLDAMRRSTQGVHQLFQALDDLGKGPQQALRAVDENGQIKKQPDGTDQNINDIYLRNEFPPAGKARAPRPGDTPLEVHQNRLNDFSVAMDRLQEAFDAIGGVIGDDGRPVVDAQGADATSCSVWRDALRKIDEELVVWSRIFRRIHGTPQEPAVADGADHDEYDSTQQDDFHLDLDEALEKSN